VLVHEAHLVRRHVGAQVLPVQQGGVVQVVCSVSSRRTWRPAPQQHPTMQVLATETPSRCVDQVQSPPPPPPQPSQSVRIHLDERRVVIGKLNGPLTTAPDGRPPVADRRGVTVDQVKVERTR